MHSDEQSMSGEERRIRDLLTQGRWRKARDAAKKMCKADRSRFLPMLIEANVGLAQQMMQKGLISDARQVIAYLKTIAPREVWQNLDLDAALLSGDYSAVASSGAKLLGHGDTALCELERRRVADRLVVAFQPITTGDSAVVVDAKELAAVHQALEAVSAEQFERATECIRPLPHDSLFRHWKLFIKGLIAFHRGDADKASRLLIEVPQETVAGQAALPYLSWLGVMKGGARLKEMPEHALELLVRLAGGCGVARVVVHAERLWQEGRPREMYKYLRNSLAEFPSENQDWHGVLSEFCMNCLFILSAEERDRYGAFLDELDFRRRTRSQREVMMLLRILCLESASDPDPTYLQAQWERFLQLRDRLDGPDRQLSSLAYEWLGSALAAFPDADCCACGPLRAQGSNMLDARGAVRALRKSIDLDRENLSAQLLLVKVYDQLKRKSDRNRLLDDMTRRFPENKQVLLLAGQRCIDRKAYKKGLTYLHRAWEQDRLDPVIPEAIALASILRALEHFRRGRLVEAHRIFHGLQNFLTERPDDFIRARWSIILRKGVLEHLYGDEAAAREFLTDSQAIGPSPEAILLFAHILWKLYKRQGSKPDPYAREFRQACQVQASAKQGSMLIRILDFWRSRDGAPPLKTAESLVRDYLRRAARRPFTREDVLALIEYAHPRGPLAAETSAFAKAILKKDSRDPRLRLYLHRCRRSEFDPPAARRKTLEAIQKEAVIRKDELTIQAVRKELNALDLPVPPPPIGPFFDDLADLEAEADLDEIVGSMPDFASSLDPGEREMILNIREFLQLASEREIREFKKQRPKDIPEAVFDMFLDSILNSANEPESAPDRQPPRRRKSRQHHPNQGSLFEL